MEGFYTIAESIVNNAQPTLDGGVFTFFLTNLVNISNSPFFGDTNQNKLQFMAHFGAITGSGGFFAGIFFAVVWCIGLLIGFSGLWWLRFHKKSQNSFHISPKLHLRSSGENTSAPNVILSKRNSRKHNMVDAKNNTFRVFNAESDKKSVFFMARRQIQSKWICTAVQFILITVLLSFLFVLCVIGLFGSYTLHANLATEPRLNMTLPSVTMSSAPRQHKLFPGIVTALASMRAYLTEFLNNTRTATKPAVNELIRATVDMQNETTLKFNDLLFEMLGIDRAFTLGDKLGAHTVRLLQLALPLKMHVHQYTDSVSNLNMAIARWNGYMEQLNIDHKITLCANQTEGSCRLPKLARSDLSVRSDWRLNQFDFAIALNFVTDVQKRTPESIKDQLTSSRILAQQTLSKTIERMRVELDIPGSIRNITESQWLNIAGQLEGAIEILDKNLDHIMSGVFPAVTIISSYILAAGCAFWLGIVCISFGITWLLCQYHCVVTNISSSYRQNINCAASCGLVFLIFAVLMTCSLFVAGGYAFTEVCRYITPTQSKTVLVKVTNQTDDGEQHLQLAFALDVHLNSFLDKNWQQIVEYTANLHTGKGGDSMPIPRVRSPIKALGVACSKNIGILDAFDAVDNFDFSVLNKPEIIAQFINTGRNIMKDSLVELDAGEMFPPALMESVQLASRLDDFLIPFEEVRSTLPHKFLNLTSHFSPPTLTSEEELSELWKRYLSFLSNSNFSKEVITRADEMANHVFNMSKQITYLLKSIDLSLKELGELKPIGPTVLELQKTLDNLVGQLNNRSSMVSKAVDLYDTHVAVKMPVKTELVMQRMGPLLVREVGRCRRLHDAYVAGTSAICDGIVSPLNGLWLFSGLCCLLATISLISSLCLLLHKQPSFTEMEKHHFIEKVNVVDSDSGVSTCVIHQPSKYPIMHTSVNGVCILSPSHDVIRVSSSQTLPATPV